MARRQELLFALNSGGVDKEALSRIDLERLKLAGEHPVTNWLPRVLGPMTIRPGLESVDTLSAYNRHIPFVRDDTTAALLSFGDQTVTIRDRDGAAIQVANPASSITNPTFTSGGGGWTDVSETGAGTDATAVMNTGLTLTATRWRAAGREQSVSIAGGDQATAHTIRIVVTRGPIFFRVGTASGGEQLLTETRLTTGTHKLTVTPGAATIYIRIRSEDIVARSVASCQFEHTALGGAGNLTLPTPWTSADLPFMSYDQSLDVMFVGDGVYQPRRIERRGDTSWSIVLYESRNGPLQTPNTDKITLAANVLQQNGTLTSNIAYFKQSHVGTLFELTHNQQQVSEEFVGFDQATDKITVNGLFSSSVTFNDRNISVIVDFTTGSASATVALERSTDLNGDSWAEVETYPSAGGNINKTYNDEQSNLQAHYRLRVTAYTSGYVTGQLGYVGGSRTGLVRITAFSSSTSVSYEVIHYLGSTNATRNWRGPVWSDDLGWPRVPRFRDDRLHWFRKDRDFGSAVDDYDNFDDSIEGDSAPIDRSAGSTGEVRWALSMDRFAVGTSLQVSAIQPSDLNEVVTPTSYTVRPGPSVGASYVAPTQVDDIAIMADKTNKRLYDVFVPEAGTKLKSTDITRLNPSAVAAGIVDMAVQRQPDTRVYIVLDDGTCAVLTYEREDKVVAFTTIETDGTIEDVAVLPGTDQDAVFFGVLRNGARYLERLANEADQRAKDTCTLLDGFKVLTGSISSITGASHLNGKTAAVWADGIRRADVAISGGTAALGATYSRVVYGLAYDCAFLSVKLAYAAQLGTAVGQTKLIKRAGLILSNSCLDGLRVGKDADNTDPMPDYVDGALRTENQFFAHYDYDLMPIASEWKSDSRIYVETDSAEGPVTVQAIVFDIETRDGAPNGRAQAGN